MKSYIVLCCTLLICACNLDKPATTSDRHYKVRVFQKELTEFGYEVYKDSVLFIRQSVIPTVSSDLGFASRYDAQKVAELVVSKLEKGETLPSVTLHELDSVKIKIP